MKAVSWTSTDNWIYYFSPAGCCLYRQTSPSVFPFLIAAWTSLFYFYHSHLFVEHFFEKKKISCQPLVLPFLFPDQLFLDRFSIFIPGMCMALIWKAQAFTVLLDLNESDYNGPTDTLDIHRIHIYLHNTLSGYSIVITVHWL